MKPSPIKRWRRGHLSVLSRSLCSVSNPQLFCAHNYSDCLDIVKQFPEKSPYVIGGAEVYRLFFSHSSIHTLYLSRIAKTCESDTFFPLDYLERAIKVNSLYRDLDFETIRYTFH